MFAGLGRPIVFAHRGDSAHAPENTLAAFRLAETNGADAIELDAKLSADGNVVVFHDATLERTTNGRGPLSSKTLSELRALDAGSHFSAEYVGECIPLLSEVFEALAARLPINIELRNYPTPNDDLVEKVCAMVKRHALERRVLFSSFLGSNLRQAARLLRAVPRALLAPRGFLGVWARSFGFTFGDYAALNPNLSDVSPQQVRRVHRLKRSLNVWTVNTVEDVRRLTAWDVDGIITDDPAMALRALGRRP